MTTRRLAMVAGVSAITLAVGLSVPGAGGRVTTGTARPVATDGDPATVAAAERRALADIRAQAASARARSAAYDDDADKALTEADRAARRAAATAARIQAIEAERALAQAAVRTAQQRLVAARRAIDARRAPLMQLTASLQALSRRPLLSVLAEPGDLSDLVHSRAVVMAALAVVRERTRELRRDVALLARDEAARRRAVVELGATTERLAAERAALAALESRRRVMARRLDDASQLETERAVGLAEQARDIVDLLNAVEGDAATRDRLAALPGPVLRPDEGGVAGGLLVAIGLAPAADAPQPGSAVPPAYRLPVVGRVVAGLGEVAASGVRSRGLTIAVAPGAQVVAPGAGRVAFAGAYRGYDRIVIIDHGDGWVSLVTGMAAIGTAVGRDVAIGEPIGRAGPKAPRITIELRHQGAVADVAAIVSGNGGGR